MEHIDKSLIKKIGASSFGVMVFCFDVGKPLILKKAVFYYPVCLE
jgi:hypothetical protein